MSELKPKRGLPPGFAERVRAKVARSSVPGDGGCLEWTGSLNWRGYGRASFFRRNYLAHRAVWLASYGEIPDGMCVCHRCDNRKCVRPDHMFLGTNKDNTDDKMSKGRYVRLWGERVPSSKVTDKQVIEMRRMRLQGAKYRVIAVAFGITTQTAQAICTGRYWTHLPVHPALLRRCTAPRNVILEVPS